MGQSDDRTVERLWLETLGAIASQMTVADSRIVLLLQGVWTAGFASAMEVIELSNPDGPVKEVMDRAMAEVSSWPLAKGFTP
jgi:hypothetical protein